MNTYLIGMHTHQVPARGVYLGGFELGRGLKTPGQIRDEVERIQAQVATTYNNIRGELGARGAYPASGNLADRPAEVLPLIAWHGQTWIPFVEGWDKFRLAHGEGSGVLANLWGDTWDQAQDWLRQLDRVRASARTAGFLLGTSPEVLKPYEGTGLLPSVSTWGLAKLVLFALLGVGGALLLFRVLT